jgi:hypothetical protein
MPGQGKYQISESRQYVTLEISLRGPSSGFQFLTHKHNISCMQISRQNKKKYTFIRSKEMQRSSALEVLPSPLGLLFHVPYHPSLLWVHHGFPPYLPLYPLVHLQTSS